MRRRSSRPMAAALLAAAAIIIAGCAPKPPQLSPSPWQNMMWTDDVEGTGDKPPQPQATKTVAAASPTPQPTSPASGATKGSISKFSAPPTSDASNESSGPLKEIFCSSPCTLSEIYIRPVTFRYPQGAILYRINKAAILIEPQLGGNEPSSAKVVLYAPDSWVNKGRETVAESFTDGLSKIGVQAEINPSLGSTAFTYFYGKRKSPTPEHFAACLFDVEGRTSSIYAFADASKHSADAVVNLVRWLCESQRQQQRKAGEM